MPYNDASDVGEDLSLEMGPLFSLLESAQVERAASKASKELGWAFPISGDFKETWIVNRAKRHAIEMLLLASAPKFQYKQVNLQQRFDHYKELLRSADEEFAAAMQENPALFAGIDVSNMFGGYSGAGFAYDEAGRDVTYDPANKVPYQGS